MPDPIPLPTLESRVAALESRATVLETDVAVLKADDQKLQGFFGKISDVFEQNPKLMSLLSSIAMAILLWVAGRLNVVPGIQSTPPPNPYPVPPPIVRPLEKSPSKEPPSVSRLEDQK